MYNDFELAKKHRRKAREGERHDTIEAELRGLVAQVADICRRHNGAAAMVRVYTVAGFAAVCEPTYEVSANFYDRSTKATGGNFIGHRAEPFVQIKEKVTDGS